jgi:hypothetical protein
MFWTLPVSLFKGLAIRVLGKPTWAIAFSANRTAAQYIQMAKAFFNAGKDRENGPSKEASLGRMKKDGKKVKRTHPCAPITQHEENPEKRYCVVLPQAKMGIG